MQEIITINGKKYVEYIEPEKEYKRWRTEDKKEYFYINEIFDIACTYDLGNIYDNVRYTSSNYFQTEQEAIKERDKRIAIVRVNDAILSLNEGWKPDFEKYNVKYTVYYDTTEYKFIVESYCYNSGSFAIYYMKSEEVAKQIIKEHQKDLKLILGVE